MKDIRYLDDKTTLELDQEACIGCKACTLVCPHRVLAMQDGKANIQDRDACMECGACVTNCPTGAVKVEPGVGCAAWIISSWIHGRENASCDDCC
jgi:NAD-dependent dihydropyrimidine dehydrogenase PreA subunit